MSYFQDMLARMVGAQKREMEKRNAENEAYNRVLAENAEYVAGLNTLPFGNRFEGE